MKNEARPSERAFSANADPDSELLGLVRMFVEDLVNDVESMRDALNDGDMETLAMLAHRLKGAAGSYGFPTLTRQAASLEKSAREKGSWDELACELAALDALCSAARDARPQLR